MTASWVLFLVDAQGRDENEITFVSMSLLLLEMNAETRSRNGAEKFGTMRQ